MILDKNMEFSDAQAVTASAASTNVVDTGIANANLGDGRPKRVEAVVNTDFATCDSIKFTLQECDTVGGSYTTLLDGVAVLVAAAVSGKKLFSGALPTQHKRFLRGYYTIAGSNATAGKVDAFIAADIQNN